MMDCVSNRGASLRPVITTIAPFDARTDAIPLPIPVPAPVTIATRPARDKDDDMVVAVSGV